MSAEHQTSDPVTALVRLRAQIVRMAHVADELAESGTTRAGRQVALSLATQMRDAAMAADMVEASKKWPVTALEGAP
jgi:hypothetical protein